MRKYKEDYGRYTRFELPSIEECTFEDMESFHGRIKEAYPDLDVSQIWGELESFLRSEMDEADHSGNEKAGNFLREVVYWTEKRDAYSVALLLGISWEQIKDLLAGEKCTDEVRDFVCYLHSFIE